VHADDVAQGFERALLRPGYAPRYSSLDALRDSLRQQVATGQLDVPAV